MSVLDNSSTCRGNSQHRVGDGLDIRLGNRRPGAYNVGDVKNVRGKRVAAVIAVVGAVLLPATTAAAAPIPGATFQRTAAQAPFVFITAPGCSGFQPLAAAPTSLTANISGWYGPFYTVNDVPFENVRLDASVTGTVADAGGSVYHASGHFTEASTRDLFADFEVLFRGTGTMTIAGPNGVITGKAQFVALGGPPEFDVTFTDVNACNFG